MATAVVGRFHPECHQDYLGKEEAVRRNRQLRLLIIALILVAAFSVLGVVQIKRLVAESRQREVAAAEARRERALQEWQAENRRLLLMGDPAFIVYALPEPELPAGRPGVISCVPWSQNGPVGFLDPEGRPVGEARAESAYLTRQMDFRTRSGRKPTKVETFLLYHTAHSYPSAYYSQLAEEIEQAAQKEVASGHGPRPIPQ